MKNNGLYKICGFMAFAAMFISGLTGMLGLFGIDNMPAFVGEIGNFMLVASVALSGFVFVMTADLPGPNILWKVLFIVFVVLSLTGKIGSLV